MEHAFPVLPLIPAGSDKLIEAVEENNLALVTQLLDSGVDVNILDPITNARPLEVACLEGFVDIVHLLLNRGADTKLQSSANSSIPLLTPLLIAVRLNNNNNLANQREIVRLLLEHRECDVNLDNSQGKTALVAACGDPEIMEMLISAGGNVNSVDRMGRTVVQYAVMSRSVACLDILIREGACLEIPNRKGDVPLHHAARDGHLSSLKRLLEAGCNPDVGNVLRPYDTPLYSACVAGFSCITQTLLEYGADPTPAAFFHLHSNHYDVETLLMTIRFGADVHYTNPLLHGSSPVLTAISKGWYDAAKILLLAGSKRTAVLDGSVENLSVHYLSEEMRDFAEWYNQLPRGLPSLKCLSRTAIRHLLIDSVRQRGNLLRQIMSIDIPKPIKDYLCFKEL